MIEISKIIYKTSIDCMIVWVNVSYQMKIEKNYLKNNSINLTKKAKIVIQKFIKIKKNQNSNNFNEILKN